MSPHKPAAWSAVILLLFLLLVPRAWAGGEIAIVLSDEEAAYREAVAAFTAEVNRPARVFNLQGDLKKIQPVMNEVIATAPPLIFAIGARAAVAAKLWTKDRPEIPVLFAMVINWEKYDLLAGQQNIAGIAPENSLGTQFANLGMLSARVKKVGLIYSEDYSGKIVEKARLEAALLGMELLAIPARSPQDFQNAFKELSGRIDSFFVISDPVVYTMENMNWLEDRCVREKLVCGGPSKNAAQTGVLLAVDPDNAGIGAQAASLVRRILVSGESPARIGVVAPLGTKLVINLKTAARIGMTLPPATISMASELIAE